MIVYEVLKTVCLLISTAAFIVLIPLGTYYLFEHTDFFNVKKQLFKKRLIKCVKAATKSNTYCQLKYLKKLLKSTYSRNRLEHLVFEQQRDTLLMRRLSDKQAEIRHLWKITKSLNLFTPIERDQIAEINHGVNEGVLNVFQKLNLPRTYKSAKTASPKPTHAKILRPWHVKRCSTHHTYYF